MRYLPGRAFPPYAFLPGSGHHPTRDPRGHSFGREEEEPQYFEADQWRENADYLYGIDLYNHGYLWEAHEAWEGIWHKAKGDPPQAKFLQGLIQCAAACLKIPMLQPRGLESLSKLGCAKIGAVAEEQGPSYMGLDALDFARDLREFALGVPESIDERPRLEVEL